MARPVRRECCLVETPEVAQALLLSTTSTKNQHRTNSKKVYTMALCAPARPDTNVLELLPMTQKVP